MPPRRRLERRPHVGDRRGRPLTATAARSASASARYSGSSSGRSARIASRCRSTVSQSPRSIGPVSSKSFSIVRAHQRVERLGRRARRLEQRSGCAAQGDEVVRRDCRAGVVGGASPSSSGNGSRPSVLAEPGCRVAAASSVSAVTAAQAPSSCSAPRRSVNVCSGWTPKRRVCGSRAASGVAPLTCATHGPGSIPPRRRRSPGRERRPARRPGSSSRARRRARRVALLIALPTRPRAPMIVMSSNTLLQFPVDTGPDESVSIPCPCPGAAQAGATVTGIPLSTEFPDSGSVTDASVRTLTLTPG